MSKIFSTAEFASGRPSPFDAFSSTDGATRHWQLSRCWQSSADTFERVRIGLDGIDVDPEIIYSLVVAGSLGRMEAQPHSDCDLLVFIHDGIDPDAASTKAQIDAIWQCLKQQSLRLPKSWGIFATPASPAQLTDPRSLGNLNESRATFGKRIQLLLDCQPLMAPDNFRQLQRRVLQWYASAFLNEGDESQWRYLITDLVRYYKSYSAWHQFKLDVEHDDSWYIRDSKLRTSRLIMYAGLMLQLASCSQRTQDKLETVLARLTLTPLERVIDCYTSHGATTSECAELIDAYDTYYRVMLDPGMRQSMVANAPRSVHELPPTVIDGYAQIDRAGTELSARLTQFVLDRRQDWHPQFLSSWLF